MCEAPQQNVAGISRLVKWHSRKIIRFITSEEAFISECAKQIVGQG
jgi:hypothetical protein